MKRLSLPMMQCDNDCGECCGIVPCKEGEYQAVLRYARENGITPADQGTTCPWYQGGQCQVYPVRPFVCQLFGHVESLVCCKGHNRNILPSLEKRLKREYGEPTRFLHEVIPDWFVRMTATSEVPVSIRVME